MLLHIDAVGNQLKFLQGAQNKISYDSTNIGNVNLTDRDNNEVDYTEHLEIRGYVLRLVQ